MSNVRFVFPKLKLTQLLKEPGGLSVSEAIEAAQANLELIKPTCLVELHQMLHQAEEAMAADAEGREDAAMAELYQIAVHAMGAGAVCGVPGVDAALTSLCDLLDHLRTRGGYDAEAIAVHVRAWRLLMNPQLAFGGADPVLEGLRKVSARYAAA